VKHKVGDEIILPSLGKCKVAEINFKPKKVYKNPFQSISKDFNTFEFVKAFSKTTHSPQSIGNNAIRLVNKFGDSILMYQYESGGKVYTQYAFME
jgi:enoyl-[acyl-carrier-protein] reductase (NADH)